MKKIIALSLVVLIAATAFGQKKKKYEKVFYSEVTKDMGPVTIVISNGVATDAYIKYKFTVKNNTADFILLKADEIVFKANGKEIRNTEKDLLIGPNDDDYRTIDMKGADLQVESFSLEVKGISRIPAKAKSEDAENFKLPVAKNEFDAGPFHILQLKNEKKTDLVAVKFSTTYNGSKIGIVNPGQASLLTPKGTEFANMGSKGQRKPFLLKKGQEDNFTLYWKDIPVSNGDMQFANVEVIWNDTYVEANPEAIPAATIDVAMDLALTDGKNR
ncbi:hypothetical protein BH11BAC1_BH11BAC1_01370 [soil metagenome]